MAETNDGDSNETNQTNEPNAGLHLVIGDIHAAGSRSLASSLAAGLRRAIRDGRLPAGTPLPASRSLAGDLMVSRGVVVRAYEQLVAEGYLTARVGQATRVGDVHATAGTGPVSTDFVMPASPGVPELGWFPRREWSRALESAVRQVPDGDLGYGDPRGHPRLRRALAAYLGRTRAVVAPGDQIVVTSGYAQAIRLVAEALTRHGVRSAGVEDPGSIGVRTTMEGGGVRTQPVPVDEEGLDVGALAVTDLEAIVVTPAHQFPTGAVLAPRRRSRLLEWADQGRGVVLEDDYDAEYRYDRSPVGALQGLAPERVVYGGSVSKSLAPGLRLGWLVAPSWLIEELAELKFAMDITTAVLDQVALAVFIETGGLDRHIRRTARRYAARRARLLGAVGRHLPGWSVTGIDAGLHAVLTPRQDVSPTELTDAAAAARNLRAGPLSAYSHGGTPRVGLVVGYGAVTPDQIEHGVAAMAARLSARGLPYSPWRR